MAVATSTILIGAAIGAAVGGIAGATVGGGGDAIWKGALVGAVGGAVTGGVGSWAGAGAGGWAGAGAGALAGGAGGVAGGLLNAALNDGNSDAYLKGGLFGGLGGAALGAAGGYFGGGGETAINGELAADAQGIPLTSGGEYAFDDAVAGSIVDPNVASSLSGGTVGTATVDPTLAIQTPQTTAPALSDMYAAAPTNTVTDIGGSSPIPQELPGSYQAPSLSQSAFGSGGTNLSGSTDFSGVDIGQGQIPLDANPLATSNVGVNDIPLTAGGEYAFDDAVQNVGMGTKELANSPTFKVKELGADLGLDTFGFGKNATTAGKGFSMDGDLGKLLKMQGYGQLASGLMKTAGAVATAPETRQNRQQLMDLYNTQMGQLNTQANAANQYQQNLQSTYDNPEAYLSSPEAQASRSAAMQKLLAQNAAAGRRTAGLSMQNQLMMNQLSNLANYRRGLQGNIQYPNYSPAATTLNYAQQYSPTADIMGGLSSGVTPLSLYSLFA